MNEKKKKKPKGENNLFRVSMILEKQRSCIFW